MIDTKALRSRILDLAIQGKLTEQLESDGTAEELYQQIQAEKLALIKEGKIKKEKPLPEISADEIPFEIPENWMWVRLQEIVTLLGDGIHGTPKYDENGEYYFINGNNLCNGVIEIKPNTKRIDYDEFLKYKKELNDNTVLLSINGTLGNLAFYNNEKVILGKSACYFNLVKKEMKVYIYYLLKTDYFLKYANYTATGVTIRNVSLKAMNELLVPLPPLAEQKRIVERVEEIFRLLDTIDEAQEKYSADSQILKAKLITAGIQGKLTKQLESDGTAHELYKQIQVEKENIIKERQGRKDNSIKPVEDDVPYEIPVNWKWIRFGETGFFRKGPFGSSLTKSMFVPKSDDSIKVYEQQHAIKKDHTLGTYYITKEYFDESMKGFEVLPDDIIISCAGTIGETFIMPDNIEKGIINQALMRVTVVPSIDKQFFLYYFNSQLKESAKEGNGSAITNIPPFDVLKNLYFPLPPLAEQKRIADVLERVLGVVE